MHRSKEPEQNEAMSNDIPNLMKTVHLYVPVGEGSQNVSSFHIMDLIGCPGLLG
jgi:hypothetical protein